MSCPICDKSVVAAFRPFCSRRCADIDLSRWLKGSYVIPGPVGGENGELLGEPGRDWQDGSENGSNSSENSRVSRSDKGMDRE